MIRTLFIALCAALLSPLTVAAQPAFGDPFKTAAQYRQDRGPTAPATLRLTFESVTGDAKTPSTSQLVIEAAPDWVKLSQDGKTSLFDYRLNRNFALEDGGFTGSNGGSALMFRVMERQNRTYLQGILAAAKVEGPDGCDADTELGIIVGETVAASVGKRGDTLSVTCAGRARGEAVLGKGAPPPAAFWPMLDGMVGVHPQLLRQVRASNAVPARVEGRFRSTGRNDRIRSLRLVSAEAIDAPYPLTETLRNATAEKLDKAVGSGVGAAASEAVAGRAMGGAPTAESWTLYLRSQFDKGGAAAVGMYMLPTNTMFPQTWALCAGGATTQFCQAVATGQRALRAGGAPQALLDIALAEGGNSNTPGSAGASAKVIAAMQTAQSTPQKDHPALGAAYALALLKFDKAAADTARASGLPTDPRALQIAAVKAMPYNVAYWLDLGDSYAMNYDYDTAMSLYDVAFSLPMPEALSAGGPAKGKRAVVEQIRKDFPGAALPTAP